MKITKKTEFTKKNPTMSCRFLITFIMKGQLLKAFEDGKTLKKKYEFLTENRKKLNRGQLQDIPEMFVPR